jgi:hypothetical protein
VSPGNWRSRFFQLLQRFIEPLCGDQLPRLFPPFLAHLPGLLFGQFALLLLAGGESGFPIALDFALAGVPRQKAAHEVQRTFEITVSHQVGSQQTALGASVATLLGGLLGMHGLDHRSAAWSRGLASSAFCNACAAADHCRSYNAQ